MIKYLMSKFPEQGKNHILYIDNFFTTGDLLIDLKKKGIGVCGTCKAGSGLPKWKLLSICAPNLLRRNEVILRIADIKNRSITKLKTLEGASNGWSVTNTAENLLIALPGKTTKLYCSCQMFIPSTIKKLIKKTVSAEKSIRTIIKNYERPPYAFLILLWSITVL